MTALCVCSLLTDRSHVDTAAAAAPDSPSALAASERRTLLVTTAPSLLAQSQQSAAPPAAAAAAAARSHSPCLGSRSMIMSQCCMPVRRHSYVPERPAAVQQQPPRRNRLTRPLRAARPLAGLITILAAAVFSSPRRPRDSGSSFSARPLGLSRCSDATRSARCSTRLHRLLSSSGVRSP